MLFQGTRSLKCATLTVQKASGISWGDFFMGRILTLLEVTDIKIIVSRDYRMLQQKSWVCYWALIIPLRDCDALENKVIKIDADLKAYHHHDNKIPNLVINFMKLITEDWQQQQRKERRLSCKIFNN